MIKQLKIVILLVMTYRQINAQEIKPTFVKSIENIGIKTDSKDSINGKSYTFDYNIYDYCLDSNNRDLFLIIRKISGNYYKNKGYAALLDLEKNKFVWKKKINAFDMLDAKDALILSDGKFINYYNKFNGKLVWYIEDQGFYFNKSNNLFFNREISSFDANTGILKWNRNIENKYGWNDSKFINDSLFVWASSGLHLANFKNGLGWDYKLVSGYSKSKMNSAGNAALIAGGVALGLLTGFYMVPTGNGENIMHGLSSNILIIDKNLYYAASNKIISIKLDGNLNWSYELNSDSCGTSKLIHFKNFILLLNTGYAFKNNQKIKYSQAKISSFNIKDGKNIYNRHIITDNYVDNVIIRENWLFYIDGNKLFKFDIEKGVTVNELLLSKSTEINNWYFINTNNLYVSDNTNENLFRRLDSLNISISCENKKITVIKPNLELLENINFEDLFYENSSYKGNSLITKTNSTILIDKQNNKIAEFNYTKPDVIGNILYFKKRNKLTSVDLDKIIPN